METKYAVTRGGKIVVESDDFDYIKRMKEEYTYRRTGRTTRMLFQALGDPSKEIAIICRNSHSARILARTASDMLLKLGFEVIYNESDRTLNNFGKTYYFITSDQLNHPRGGISKYYNMVKYLDQD